MNVRKGMKQWANSPDNDGVLMRRFARAVSLPVARALKDTFVTPNMVTVLSSLLTIPAFLFFLSGEYISGVIAAFIALLSYLLDYVDGSLARIKNMASIYGQWLDMYFGRIGVTLLHLGIIIGMYNSYRSPIVWLWGFLAITSALMVGSMYNSIHRLLPEKSKEIVYTEKVKRRFLKNFYYAEVSFYPFLLIMAIANQLYWFLVISAIYGWIFTFVMFYILSRKIKKEVK